MRELENDQHVSLEANVSLFPFIFFNLSGLSTLLVTTYLLLKGLFYLRLLPWDYYYRGAVVAQMASAWLSEREVPGSILSDFNACFDFPLICVAIALNPLKTEH